jgi:hypothetical protein
MERPAAAIGLVILLMCSLPAAGGGTVAAADGQMKTVRIFGEEGCKNKDDFSALKRLGDAFQRDLKPVLRLDISSRGLLVVAHDRILRSIRSRRCFDEYIDLLADASHLNE